MKIKLFLFFLLLGIQSFGQNCCDTNNFFSNGDFEAVNAGPTNFSDDLDMAQDWIFIWEGGRADLYNENTPNAVIGILPSPQDGNYASCWIDNRPDAGQDWREGFMNQLNTTILPNSGTYTFSFEMANLFGFGISEIGIYGVNNPGNISLPPPNGNFSPSNSALFGASNTTLLGTFTVPIVNNNKQQYDLVFNTNSSSFPAAGISHIMITHSDNAISGSNYVAFDNFCMKVCNESAIEFTDTYESIQPMPSFYGPVDVAIYCTPAQIILDGSNSTCENSYSIEVSSFNLMDWINGPVVYNSGSINGPVSNNIDISNSFNWALNTVYRVKLTTYPCYDEENIFFMVSEPPQINLPSTYVACDGVYEEICVPNEPNYSYEWYGPDHDPNMIILLEETSCFTPTQTGNYNLFVTNEYGCTSSHTFIVYSEIPQPVLGLNGEFCIGDIITLAGQGYDNPNYSIFWFHNANLVQTGGTTLQTQFTSGSITVKIFYGDCEAVSTTVILKECCPDDFFLSIDCENQTVIIQNLPYNANIIGMTWSFNGVPISPQPNFTTILNAYLGEGVYGVTILFQLNNGEKCKFKTTVEYSEADCCEELAANGELEAIANANFVNVEGYQTTSTPYGDMDIPVLCDFLLDGSNSICEDAYFIQVSNFDPQNWIIGDEILPGTWVTGQAGNAIDFSQGSYIPGQVYWLAFNVGPGWNPIGLPFIYGLDSEVSITNISGYTSVGGTQYGDLEVPIVNCGLRLDGSASSCENSYQVIIESFDPYSWSTTPTPGEVFNQWFSGPAPNSIIIPPGTFPLNSNGFYLLTFAVGPTWTPEYVLIYYQCDNAKGNSKASGRLETLSKKDTNITIYPNPANELIQIETSFDLGIYQLYDVNGKTLSEGELISKNTSIDLSRLNAGIYFIRIQSESGEVHTKKVFKE